MRGIEIFLMITEWPETPMATSLLLDLQLAHQLLHRLDDGGGVHQRAVDDRLGRQRLHPEALQRVATWPGAAAP